MCVFNFRLCMSTTVVMKVMIPLHLPRLLKKDEKENDLQLLRNCQISPVKYIRLLSSWFCGNLLLKTTSLWNVIGRKIQWIILKRKLKIITTNALYILNYRIVFSLMLPCHFILETVGGKLKYILKNYVNKAW